MNTKALAKILETKKTMVIDGATGTNLQEMGLPIGTAPELWVDEKPDAVFTIYKKFIDAGADIILTCTFGGNRIRLKHAGLQEKAKEINQKAVRLAKEALTGKDILVAGSMGPIGEMMPPYGTLSEVDVYAFYQEQAQYLLDAEVDLLVIETQYDINEALTAIKAIRDISDIALVCSFSYDRGTHSMLGLRPTQVAEALSETDVLAIGINCGKSLDENIEVLEILKPLTNKAIWFKPNAGIPEMKEDGSMHYHISPEDMGKSAKRWVEKGADFIGGCCGTSPEHLAAIKGQVM